MRQLYPVTSGLNFFMFSPVLQLGDQIPVYLLILQKVFRQKSYCTTSFSFRINNLLGLLISNILASSKGKREANVNNSQNSYLKGLKEEWVWELQFYLQMLKNHRSTSQIITKHQSSDTLSKNILFPDNNQHLQRRQRTLVTPNSKLTFGQAKTASKTFHNQMRNKSLSCSKLKLFEKAHQVGIEQTFQKLPQKQGNKNFSASSASSFQIDQYRKTRRDSKMQEVVEKKLIIEKVVKSMQDDSFGPKLTIRRELQQRRQTKNPSSMVTVAVNTQQQFTQSMMPSDLVYSKDFDLQNQSKMGGFYRIDEHVKQKTEMNGSAYLDEQSLKNISKQLSLSIQQSIKKQMEGQYLARQRELQHKYQQKERQYMSKFKDLQSAMQVKLEKERELLIQNIHQKLEQQFDKVKDVRSVKQEQARKVQENVYQNVKTVQKQPFSQNSPKASNDLNHQNIQQIKAVQKKAPPPPILAKQLHKKQTQITNQQLKQGKLSKNNSEKPKSIFKEVDQGTLDEIQQVKLQKIPNKSKDKSNRQQQAPAFDRVNKSFNVQKQLDNSFSSERPVIRKGSTPNKKDSEQKIKPPAPPLKRQLSQEQRRKQQQQQRKSMLKAKLKEYSQFDPIMVSVGEVACFCSKFCKKSQVSWQMPSLLLYRYCLDLFRSYKPTFQQAQRLKLVKKQQLDNYNNYDVVMQTNMAKMYKSFQKKMTIPQVYKQIIDSPQIQLERLRPHAINEAKRYVSELSRSVESDPQRGDKDVVQCGLRIINSVFAIRKIDGQSVEMLPESIGEHSREQTFALFAEWSQRLNQE